MSGFWGGGVGCNDCHPQMFSKKVVHSLLTHLMTLLPVVVYTSRDIYQTAFKIKIPFLTFVPETINSPRPNNLAD